MLFNSYIFLLLFFPLTLAGYYILKKFDQILPMKLWLIGMSLWFYGYFNPWYLFIILGSIAVNYLLCVLMRKYAPRDGKLKLRKSFMILGVVFNVGILFYYKYFNFFIDNINSIFKTNFFVETILLPLGISFFTFQEIGFMVDAYRGEVEKLTFVDFALFVTFFPQLIAGPIVTQDEMLPQLNNMNNIKFSSDKFARGLSLFILGLMKKVLIADVFGNAVDWAFQYADVLDGTNSIIALLFANFQMYFDFSGYCDMAKGIGAMFMLDIPQNFNSPYKAKSVIEFWSRWQITMPRFLTRYIYIPLGGSRKGEFRTYLNTLIVFTISGIWHGAGWKYLIWGVMYGVLNCFARALRHQMKKVPGVINNIVTFFFVACMGGFFRAESTAQGFMLFKQSVVGKHGGVTMEIVQAFMRDEFRFLFTRLHLMNNNVGYYVVFGAYMLIAFYFCFIGPNAVEISQKLKMRVWEGALLALGLVWVVISLSEVSTFLYFNF